VTDGVELTLRLGLLALLLTLLIAVPKQASSSPIRNALGVFVLFAGFLGFCALLAEALAGVTLYAVPVSGIVVVALLWWVIEPKITPRLRPLLPDRQTVQALLSWAVRLVGFCGAAAVYGLVLWHMPVAVSAVITGASGLLFLGGLLAIVRQLGPPTSRRQRLQRLSGFAFVVLGMIMTYGGSYGADLLVDFPYETGTRGVIMYILFGPVFALGPLVFILGLYLLYVSRRRD
jgi:hypothetical protein